MRRVMFSRGKDRLSFVMVTYIIIAFFISLVSSGCSDDMADVQARVIEHDPEFRSVLEQRDNMQKEIDSLREKYASESSVIDENIRSLKAKKRQLKDEMEDQISSKMEVIKKKRESLQQEVKSLDMEYQEVSGQEKKILSDISEIESLMEKKDNLGLSSGEMQVWKNRLNLLKSQKIDVERQRTAIKEDKDILLDKIRTLRLR